MNTYDIAEYTDEHGVPDLDKLAKALNKSEVVYLRTMPAWAIDDSPTHRLIRLGLVVKNMISSGRNPVYGWTRTMMGDSLVMHIEEIAVSRYLRSEYEATGGDDATD